MINQNNGLSQFDINGNKLWETNPPVVDWTRGESKYADVDGDGIKEVVTLWNKGMSIHKSTNGELVACSPHPKAGPYDRIPEKPNISHIYPADLDGKGYYNKMIVKDDSSA